MKRGPKSYFCESCNATIADSTAHRASVFHRQGRRIRRLLAKPCITYAEIGRRVGVSRERVRQIHDQILKLKPEGRERRAVCAFNHPVLPPKGSLAQVLKIKCAELKISFEFVNSPPTNHRHKSYSKVLVDGKRCELRTATVRKNNGHLVLRKARGDYDFALYRIGGGARWIVLPREKSPNIRTEFVEKPMGDLGRTKDRRHDWPDYIEAWHLLR